MLKAVYGPGDEAGSKMPGLKQEGCSKETVKYFSHSAKGTQMTKTLKEHKTAPTKLPFYVRPCLTI
jgi:hypothetical protein